MFDSLDGARITVMGLGRFGGGLGVTRWLVSQGATVTVSDRADEADLAPSIHALTDLTADGRVRLHVGEHRPDDFTDTDGIIANPAVPQPWDHPLLNDARERSIPISTEIELVIGRLPARDRVIGITGTAGKSTTASLITHIARAAGLRVHLGGNIGGSLLPTLDEISPDDLVVLELSSAMLHWIDGWSPGTAIVTGFAPNHMDWHGTPEHYHASKAKLLASQTPGDRACVSERCATRFQAEPGVTVIEPAAAGDPIHPLRLIGTHNEENARLAVAACVSTTTIHRDTAWRHAAEFGGLAHRLQTVRDLDGVRFVNDSKSTTPDATALALQSVARVTTGTIHLIAGGYDKGIQLDPMDTNADCLVYAIGSTAGTIGMLFGERATVHATLDEAFAHAASIARNGDTVLLSPGCASWDQFTNFEARGDRFIELTNTLDARSASTGSMTCE